MFEILLIIILILNFLVLLCIARLMWLELKRKGVVGKKYKRKETTLEKYIHQVRG